MKIVKGKVEQINVKDPMDFGKGRFANYGIKVGEEWHNSTCNEVNGAFPVLDKNRNEVKVGMEVEFLVKPDKNGYEKIDKTTFTILASGSAVPQQQQSVSGQDASIAMSICRGIAATHALFKFKGNYPEDIDSMIERMAKHYFNGFAK